MKRIKSVSGVIAIIAIVGLAGFAFANGRGMMGGGMMMGSGMMGRGHGNDMMDQGRGYGHHMEDYGYDDLSPEQADRLKAVRNRFFEETRQLNIDIRDKQFALNDELAKPDTDTAKVTQMQKTLSQLKSDYDQQALAFELETRKIVPDGIGGRGLGSGYANCRW